MAVRGRLIALTAAIMAVAAVGLWVLPGGPAHAVGRAAQAAKAQPFGAKLSYQETNQGHQQGAATTGIVGLGTFSARLGAHAALAAAVLSLATGVPVSKIAQGGSYVVQRQIAGSGVVSGLAVAKFKAAGLGTACLSYTEKPGKFVPGGSFVPMTGTIKTVGGTGAAARWRLSVSFKQNSLTGSRVESFGAGGSEQASTGAPRALTAACRHVATLS